MEEEKARIKHHRKYMYIDFLRHFRMLNMTVTNGQKLLFRALMVENKLVQIRYFRMGDNMTVTDGQEDSMFGALMVVNTSAEFCNDQEEFQFAWHLDQNSSSWSS